MRDFNYYAPTEVVFGKHSEQQVAALMKLIHKVLKTWWKIEQSRDGTLFPESCLRLQLS